MQTAPPPESFQSSDLSRHSSKVFAAAVEHPIRVTRRDGESLVLMSQRESDARESLLQLAAQIIGAAIDDEGTLAERMADRPPIRRRAQTTSCEPRAPRSRRTKPISRSPS